MLLADKAGLTEFQNVSSHVDPKESVLYSIVHSVETKMGSDRSVLVTESDGR